MTPSRGNKNGRSGSFSRALSYALHDKGARTTERVGMVELLNLGTSDPARAAGEMRDTFEAADSLKRRLDISPAGQKNERPVYSFSLSWHELDRPTTAHMTATAKEALKALGLEEHQAVIVEHRDRPHRHVHVIVNLIHPETGRTADLAHDMSKLSRFSYLYEKAQGTIRSAQRAFRHGAEKEPQLDIPAKKHARAIQVAFAKRKEQLEQRHDSAYKAERDESNAHYEAYRGARAEIYDRFQKLADDVWRRQPKQAALILQPGSFARRQRPEWLSLAKAMKQPRAVPLRREFAQALHYVLPPGVRSTLGRVFSHARVREAYTPIAQATHRAAQGTRRQRTDQLKVERNGELLTLARQFEADRHAMQGRHTEADKVRTAERRALHDEQKLVWAKWRRDHGIPDDGKANYYQMRAGQAPSAAKAFNLQPERAKPAFDRAAGEAAARGPTTFGDLHRARQLREQTMEAFAKAAKDPATKPEKAAAFEAARETVKSWQEQALESPAAAFQLRILYEDALRINGASEEDIAKIVPPLGHDPGILPETALDKVGPIWSNEWKAIEIYEKNCERQGRAATDEGRAAVVTELREREAVHVKTPPLRTAYPELTRLGPLSDHEIGLLTTYQDECARVGTEPKGQEMAEAVQGWRDMQAEKTSWGDIGRESGWAEIAPPGRDEGHER